jgi:tetratricopeptide (TPR) repeat protein
VQPSSDVLFDQVRLRYYINNSFLTIGTVNYKINKLSADSLVISETGVNIDSSKLRKYYYVKQERVPSLRKPVFSNTLKDSVYHYTRYLFPECNGNVNLVMDRLNDGYGYDNGDLKIGFVINKNGKLVEFSILESNQLSKGFIETLKTAFEAPGITWVAARLNTNPVNAYIEISMSFTKTQSIRSHSFHYPLFQLPQFSGIDQYQMENANKLYFKGLKEAKAHNYQKAIEALNKCLAIDVIYLDAYYLRAYCCLELGNMEDTYRDWKTLADLGQVRAARFLKDLKK